MGVEIQIEHLTKSFGKQLIWGDVSLTIPAGEISVMLGPSGTGKSVLLKTLIGLLKPDSGQVIEGVDIASCPEKVLRPMRGLRTERTASVVIRGHAIIGNLRRGHYELAVDAGPLFRLAIAFDEFRPAI